MSRIERVAEKFYSDYKTYFERETSRSPIEIFNNCFEYAIVSEWMCLFEQGSIENHDDELNNDIVFSKIMRSKNLVDRLVSEVAWCSSVELCQEAFDRYFEAFLWTLKSEPSEG